MEKKHFYYIDYMRIFAMACVVFMHAAASSLRMYLLSDNWMALSAVTSLAFCAVPLFFMISGQLMLTSEKTGQIGYVLKKRIPKLVVPLVVYSVIASIWLSFLRTGAVTAGEWLQILKGGLTEPVMIHFWFMYTLIGMTLISPLLYGGIKLLSSDKGRLALGVFIAIVVGLKTLHLFSPETVGSWIPFRIISELWFFNGHIYALLIGWLLSLLPKKIPNLLLVLVAAADLALIIWGTQWLTGKFETYTATFQSQNHALEILLAMCIFLLCRQNLNRPFGRLNDFLKPLANLAFPIYLLHNIMISILYYYDLPHERALDVGIAAILVILICYAIIKTLATIRPLCYLFTGMTYKEACKSCNWIYTISNIRKKQK
ncbi:MAG: acyltransferase [Clostridiales bacterium]|nr:acyltransferase [Clostridiales bacterium]